ncbi:mannosyl-oligosaccharide glucosidase [Reticulomyxa filosa]|uniref:Mannosyl-oligosaccharide glucosidase n=1 Tax=Reticulomyxa filosa TaxID=46433 RepID=X6NG97_RETFI|nr:mannosyl-oligosaccharide glucosidase [Reticulomyxa filosa]|eukprot:ETO25350.1 mannosyl-oligosaccharide glucosidase [Reticulomyxa filosa]
MWYDGGNLQQIMKIRHECQDGDHLSMYGWQRHNGRDFGHELLVDPEVGVQIGISFAHFPYASPKDKGQQPSTGWVAYIEGQRLANSPKIGSGFINTIWYIISGGNATDITKEDLSLKHPNRVFKNKNKKAKYTKDHFIQLVGTIRADSTANQPDQHYSVIQIFHPNTTFGASVKPTQHGEWTTTNMDHRTLVTGLHMSDQNKWKTKDIAQQLVCSLL